MKRNLFKFNHISALRLIAASFMMLLIALHIAPAAEAQNTTLVVNKKACAASILPANIATNANAATLLDGCAPILSVSSNSLFYYVITVVDISPTGQTVSISDNLPPGFSQVSAPPAFCIGCSGGTGTAPNLSSVALTGSGNTIYIVVPGYFTQGGNHQNKATVTPVGGEKVDSPTIDTFAGTPTPPAGNLKVEKTSSITSASMNGGSGSVSVNYTITVTNTGTTSVNLGDTNPSPTINNSIFELVDNASALPGGSLGFSYTVSPANFSGCDTYATSLVSGNISCPDNQTQGPSGATTNSSNGSILGVWTYADNDPGVMTAGSSYTLSFSVTYSLDNTVVCVWPETLDGKRKNAYIRFANGQISFSDTNASDNTSFVDLEVNDHGITDICEKIDDQLNIQKVQKTPVGIVPWGATVTYVITVTNPVGIGSTGAGIGPAVNDIAVTDVVQMLPGMPVTDVTALSITCVTSGISCSLPVPPPITTQTLSTYYNSVNVASIKVDSLADGQSVDIVVEIAFKPRSCMSYDTKGPRQTADIASYFYKITGKYGMVYEHGNGSDAVITDHDKVPPCTLKTEKTGPKDVTFGTPLLYQVTYENYGDDPIEVGTLIDSISLNSSVYASPGVSGSYTYGCAYFNPGPQPWGPLNLLSNNGAGTPILVSYNALPGQGTRLLQQLNPAAPVVFPPHSKIVCDFKVILAQPTNANPYCQGAGEPKLVNHALMDASYYFNTNYDPNASLPPPGSPVGLPESYATTEAGLPLCHRIQTGKSISPMIAEPDDPATTTPDDPVTVTLTLKNTGDDPITGATLLDTVPNNLIPISGTLNCPLCSPPLINAPISGQVISQVFGTLASGQTGTVTFQANAQPPTPMVKTNHVDGNFTPPPGNWYDQGSDKVDDFVYGVFDKELVTITKQVVNMSPQPFPLGPFPINVNCTLPGYPTLNWSYSHTASVTIPAGGTSFSYTLPVELPVGAVCTFTETSVPSGTTPYGFSAVGYSPAVGSGLSGSLTVALNPRNENGINTGIVENCYGTPGLPSPLQQPHVVGKDCPPVINPSPKFRTEKICSPAILAPDGQSYIANCEIIAWTSGEFPAGYSVQESFGANGQVDWVASISTPSTMTWGCAPTSASAPGVIDCPITGGTQQAGGPNQVSHHFVVTFKNEDEVNNSKNCAFASINGEAVGEDCEPFVVDKVDNKYAIEKICGEVKSSTEFVPEMGNVTTNSAECVITVTASPGPVIGMLSVTDTFTSVPNSSSLITALSGAGWTCNPNPSSTSPIAAGAPFTCTMPGALFPTYSTNGQSTITATVSVPVGEDKVQNCATLSLNDERKDTSCGDIIINTTPRVEKKCESPYRPVGSTNWLVNCSITVTPTGPMTGTVTVNDVMSVISGSATITNVNLGVWNCSPVPPITTPNSMSCSTQGNSLTGPTTIGVTMSVPAGTTGLKNCAVAVVNESQTDQFCVDIPIPPEPPRPDIEKKCDPVVWDAAAQRFKTKCTITISATGYSNGTLTFAEQMSASGAPAQLDSLAQAGWTCNPATVPPVLTTGLQVICHRPAAGFTNSTVNVDISFPQGTAAIKNCAKLYWSPQPINQLQLQQTPLLDKSCTYPAPVDIPPVKAEIQKKCTDATLLPAPNPSNAYGSTCTVTVTTSGAVQTPISFTENLFATGSTSFIGSTPSGWACVPATVPNSTTMNCTYSGAVNPVSNSWDVTFNVTFPNATTASNAKNCVKLKTGSTSWNDACHSFTAVAPTPPTLNVTKSCAVLEQYTDALAVLDCTITVTATGTPLPPVISVTENLQSTNTVTNSYLFLFPQLYSSDPGWTCPAGGSAILPNTPVTCTIPGASFPASGTSTLHAYMYSDQNITPGSTQNCVTVSGNTVPPVTGGPACVPIGPSAPTTGTLHVLKEAKLNGQSIPQQSFPMTVTCGSNATNIVVFNDGPSVHVPNIPFGTACTVVEDTPPTTGLCPAGQAESWSTIYDPASPVLLTATNTVATITVKNTLTCTPIIVQPIGRLQVKKTVDVPQGVNINAVNFPVTVDCGGNLQGGTISVNTPLILNGLSTTTACTVTEGTPPTANICPAGKVASWTKLYTPPSQTVTPTAAGVQVKILNTLTCSSMPSSGALSVTKVCAPSITSPNGGVDVQCTITASVTGGPTPAVITLSEKLDELITMNPGAAQITSLSSAQPWTFPSLPINSEVNAPITLNGTNMPSNGTSTITVGMHFADVGMLGEMQNCVSATGGPVSGVPTTTAPQVCAQFTTFPPNIVVTPPCNDGQVKLSNGKCGTPPPPPPKCNPKTTKLVDGQCLCTIRGMKPVTKTDCACSKGQEIRDGRCRDIPPPPPPAPKCDARSTVASKGACVCKIPGAVKVSPTACGCPSGTELIKGKCRVPPPPAPNCDPETTIAKGGQCVCKFRGMRPVSKSECNCRKGSNFVPGKGCVREQIECPKGTIQQGDLCIKIKRDNPVEEKDCPPGTRKVGPLCVRTKIKLPDSAPTPDNPPTPGKLCTDREGKEVPCD